MYFQGKRPHQNSNMTYWTSEKLVLTILSNTSGTESWKNLVLMLHIVSSNYMPTHSLNPSCLPLGCNQESPELDYASTFLEEQWFTTMLATFYLAHWTVPLIFSAMADTAMAEKNQGNCDFKPNGRVNIYACLPMPAPFASAAFLACHSSTWFSASPLTCQVTM